MALSLDYDNRKKLSFAVNLRELPLDAVWNDKSNRENTELCVIHCANSPGDNELPFMGFRLNSID